MIVWKAASPFKALNDFYVRPTEWWEAMAASNKTILAFFHYSDGSGARMGSGDTTPSTALIQGKLFVGIPMGGFWIRDDAKNVRRVDPRLPAFENEDDFREYLKACKDDETKEPFIRNNMTCATIHLYGKIV